jgi:hypothetical protein
MSEIVLAPVKTLITMFHISCKMPNTPVSSSEVYLPQE